MYSLFRINNKWLSLCSIITVALLCFTACKKVDDHINEVVERPWVVDRSIGFKWQGTIKQYDYPTGLLVGDTMTLLGNFFLERPGSRIRVGNVNIVPLDTATIPWEISASWDPNEKIGRNLQMVRFLITKEMGIGSNRPISITANGITIEAPVIGVRQISAGLNRTDTTLWVDKLTGWMAEDMSHYQRFTNSMVNNPSVTGNGHVYFDNLEGIYRLADGKVTAVIKNGRKFTEDNQTFEIEHVASSAMSFDEQTLYFSVAVIEAVPDASTHHILRLCKMDMASGAVKTINRTLVQKTGDITETITAFQGDAATLKLVAGHLKTTPDGHVFFVNIYKARNSVFVDWYTIYVVNKQFDAGVDNVIGNICSLSEAGQVTSLVSPQFGPIAGIPGYPAPYTAGFYPSAEGNSLLICDKVDWIYSAGLLDLKRKELLSSSGTQVATYRIMSYDTAADTRSLEKEMPFGVYNFMSNNMLLLADNTILMSVNSSWVAANLQEQTLYCYAGTERGMAGPAVEGQNKETGKAKYVLFHEGMKMAGMDKQGTIYYYAGDGDFVNGVKFYKLYSKK
ncbi:hypothetical protein [Chitinophaga nivalis]|uniref:Uncharacterized protein n=1 Tax=Chitinophaga nivalis TaxID=2991709 RepID=A0ABT3IRD5_9BACT|nr:hypothetical protein [Chitinophaga nivalis]MCW3463781.1 hypothetical protein [Chitinophaga nivalis]MCW3486529.1 hypothetical protein [Chitinophaga nivalis]